MSMSTHIVGFKPPDEKWQRMKAVWDACAAAKCSTPKEVAQFFGHTPPDAAGVSVNIEGHACVTHYLTDGCQGYDIDVTKLPQDVTVVRVYNSW